MLRAVIFDLHGTLLDDEALRVRLSCDLAREDGLAVDAEETGRRLAGLDDRTALQLIWAERGRPLEPHALRRLLAEKARRYEAALAGRVPLFPGARALVEEVARRVPVGVVATSPRADAQAALKAAGLFHLLAALVAADDVPRPANAYEACIAEMGRVLARYRMEAPAPRNVLVIEDTEAGIAAARAAGAKVAAVAHTQRLDRLAGADTHAARLIDLELGALERELF